MANCHAVHYYFVMISLAASDGGVHRMSFAAFEQAIEAPALRAIARHWNAVRGERRLPGWRDIRPSAIAAHLPLIWSYRYDRQADRFVGRLAGDSIEAVFSHSFRGAPMEELFPPAALAHYTARHRRVVMELCFFRGHGQVFDHLGRMGLGERIILPLADNGVEGDGILGATLYDPAAPAARDALSGGEIEEWFPLG